MADFYVKSDQLRSLGFHPRVFIPVIWKEDLSLGKEHLFKDLCRMEWEMGRVEDVPMVQGEQLGPGVALGLWVCLWFESVGVLVLSLGDHIGLADHRAGCWSLLIGYLLFDQ